MQNTETGRKLKIIKVVCAVAVCWIFFVVLATSVFVRNWLAAPLVVHDESARGNACYILAGGGSLRERLDAGIDLIQMGRVSTLIIMQDDSKGPYSFGAKSSWTRTRWTVDYLFWRGISGDRISFIPQINELFGTLKEARSVAKNLSKDVKTLVVVSSAPHMRRTVLAFRRSLPADVKVVPFAATTFENSYEMYYPIWLEYLKLLVYFVIA